MERTIGVLLLAICCYAVFCQPTRLTVCPSKNKMGECDYQDLAQALLNVSKEESSLREIYLLPGTYKLSGESVTINQSGINLFGNCEDASQVVITCDQKSGFHFSMANNLTITNLTINGCGQTIADTQFGIFTAALYMNNCNDVTISNVVIANTEGVGLFGANLCGKSVLHNIVFMNNTIGQTSTSGGAFLVFQGNQSEESENYTLLEITDCHFKWNMATLVENLDRPSTLKNAGGGLKVAIDQVSYHVNIAIKSTTFEANTAAFGAGVTVGVATSSFVSAMMYSNWSFSSFSNRLNVSIQNCTFANNTAMYGASALLAYRENICDNIRMFISDCLFSDNIASSYNIPKGSPTPTMDTTVSIQNIDVSLQGANEFTQNHGTALEAITSRLSVCGDVHVVGNVGVYGGGFRLLRSAYIVICNHTSFLNFTENTALVNGGAVYVGQDETRGLNIIRDPCFFYIERVCLSIGSCSDYGNFTTPVIFFSENNAKDLGDAVYGSTLETCWWRECVYSRVTTARSVYDGLVNLGIIDFGTNNTLNSVRARVDSIHVTHSNVSVMPGQLFHVKVTLLDKLQQTVSGIVEAAVTDSDASVENGPWVIDCSDRDLSLVLNGTPAQKVVVSFYVDGTMIHAEVVVTLTMCSLGFSFNATLSKCTCQSWLATEGFFCDNERALIHAPVDKWIGPVPNHSVGIADCAPDYCQPVPVEITNNDFDFQCRHNKTGVGCGACRSGYSALLGSTQCQECTHLSLLLVLLFAITGVLTIVGMSWFRITLTEGYLNGVLFYSNVINAYAMFLSTSTAGKGVFVVTAWISQNFGIPACFYDGMTTLAVSGLQLLYVGYLFALTIFLSVILRYRQHPFASEYSPSKVLGTLLVLCYTSLLGTCVQILSFTSVITIDGEIYKVWYFDPSVTYFSGLHAFLCVLAILIILVYIIPFPFLIISPRLTFKIHLFNKLQPLLDTLWAPFKPKCSWWLSFRLLIRCIAVILSLFVPVPYNIVSVIILLAILLFMQSHLRPLHGHWQNAFDDVLLLNLIIIFSGFLFFYHKDNTMDYQGIEIYSSIFVMIAYFLFTIALVIHLFKRFPQCKPFLLSLPSKLWNSCFQRRYRPLVHDGNIQEEKEELEVPVSKVTHSEINITKEQKEEDKRNLIREVIELESISLKAADTSHTKVNPFASLSTDDHSHYKLSLKEPAEEEETANFPMRITQHFDEYREPLLEDDSV